MGFSAELRRQTAAIWQAQLEHPFVRGIADGSLDVERFQFWLRQDYLFLIEYCRLIGLAAARAPDIGTLTKFADLLHSTARTEMDLHRSYAAGFGIPPSDLEDETMAPTTRAYTDFLVRIAATGDFAELAAALLPCMWGYSELGSELARPGPPAHRYAEWIQMYSSEEFAQLAAWCRELVDEIAEGVDAAGRGRMQLAFVTSSRYELAFWQMAWTQERWLI